MLENTGKKQGRWEKGRSGNPSGRPKGVFNKTTLAAQALLDGEAERITRICIQQALRGNPAALKLCLERLVPPTKERPIVVSLPKLEKAGDALRAVGHIIECVGTGEVTPNEAAVITGLLVQFQKVLEDTDIEHRLVELEARVRIAR